MIVIGADVHKSTHALAAVDANTGQLLGEREIPANEQGHLSAAQRLIKTPYRASGVPWRSVRVSHSPTEGEL